MDALLKAIFLALVVAGFAEGILLLIIGARTYVSYGVYRGLLAEQGVMRFDSQSGMPWRMGEELDALYRLYIRVPEDDPTIESARREARTNSFRFIALWGAMVITAAVGILVGVAADLG